MGFSPTVENPTAIDTATDALTTSLPEVTATSIALEVTAHHSVDQHWRPAHDEAVLSAIVCTANQLIVSTVRCRSRSSRQADRRPPTTVTDARIDASKPRVIDRRSPLTRPNSSAGRPTSSGHPRSTLDGHREARTIDATNAAVRMPRSPDDQRRSTPLSPPVATTVRTARSDDAGSPSNRPVETAVATAINTDHNYIRNMIGLTQRCQPSDGPHSPVSGCINFRIVSAETRCVAASEDSRIYTWNEGGVPAVPTAVIRPFRRPKMAPGVRGDRCRQQRWLLQRVTAVRCGRSSRHQGRRFARPIPGRVRTLSISYRMYRPTSRSWISFGLDYSARQTQIRLSNHSLSPKPPNSRLAQ